jgi:hypothetical protein
MRRRRPVPLLLLFLLVTAAGVYVLLSSFAAEREYQALVHTLGSGEGARVLESRYTRGWLSSKAYTSIESEGMPGVLFRRGVTALGALEVRPRVGIHMSHEIEHGMVPLFRWAWDGFEGLPILARMRSKIEIDQEAQLALAEVLGNLPAIEADTVIRTSGQARTTFAMPGDQLRTRGGEIERDGRWLGLDGELSFTSGFQRVVGYVHAPGIESRGEHRIVKVSDVSWAFELPAGELPLGQMNLDIGELIFDYTTAGATPVELEDLDIDGESKAASGGFGANVKVSLRSLRLGDERWGPGSLKATIANVDGPGFRKLKSAGVQLQAERGDSDPAKTAVMAASVLEALPQLLARQPRLDVERLQLKTPAGLATASVRFALTEPASREALTATSFLDGELSVEMPAVSLEDIVDAQVRAKLASEGADASDEAGFEALAQQRRAERLAELRTAGFVMEGDRAVLKLAWGKSAPVVAPAPPPVEKTAAKRGRRGKPQPPAQARTEPAPQPSAPAAPAPAPAAPAPAPEAAAPPAP